MKIVFLFLLLLLPLTGCGVRGDPEPPAESEPAK